MKGKIKSLLVNDIFWIFFLSIMAGLFGKLYNIYRTKILGDLGIFFTIVAVAYLGAWIIISIHKQLNK